MPRYPLATLLLLPMLLALLGGCVSERPLLQADYAASRGALARGAYDDALARLPEGEAGSFITTMERTYLSLLAGRPEIDALADYRDLLRDRVRFEVSRELRSFFYLETPEGYYASEHEIVWMHLLLSWGWSLRGEREKGCVEARQAGHLLAARWSEEGHFDDPTLRSILGVLWALCGSWQDAQVDFRVAAALDPTLGWAQALADRVTPPRNLFLVLGGVGPEPVWDPTQHEPNPLRGLRHLAFQGGGRRSELFLETAAGRLLLHLTPDSMPWYERHQARGNVIQEAIGDTQYGLKGTGEAGLYATRSGAGIAYWTGITTAGVIGGAAAAYGIGALAAQANSGEGIMLAVYLGIGIPVWAYNHGKEVYEEMESASAHRLKAAANPALGYRFVRFLPEYAWVGWSDADLGPAPRLAVQRKEDEVPPTVFGPVGPGRPRVFIAHTPDAGFVTERQARAAERRVAPQHWLESGSGLPGSNGH